MIDPCILRRCCLTHKIFLFFSSETAKAREARLARAIKIGTLRPAIVLYDEPHPLGDDIGTIQTADLARRPDMLVIMGTSLKVHGFKKLVKEFARAVHETAPSGVSTAVPNRTPIGKSTAKSHAGKVVFVNKTPPGTEWEGIIDYWVEAESDRWVEKVLEDWKKMIPGDWEVQQKLDGVATGSGAGGFKVMKDLNGAVKEKSKGKRKENIPPDVLAIALSTPLPPSPPASPSKRRTAICHYSDDEDESSPSKKRAPSSRSHRDDSDDADDLPGMLFGNATNNARAAKGDDSDNVFLVPSQGKERARPKSRTAKSAPARSRSVSRSKAATKSKLEVVVRSRKPAASKVR